MDHKPNVLACVRVCVCGCVGTSLRYFRDNEYEERKLAYLIAGNPKRRNVNLKLPRSYLHESGQEGHINKSSARSHLSCVITAVCVFYVSPIECSFLVLSTHYNRIYGAAIVQSV